LLEVIDRVFSGPFFVVYAGIDHETSGAPKLERQSSEIRIRIPIHADFFGRQFAVKAPAFRVSGIGVRKFAELGNAGQFLGDGSLHVVPGSSFVIRKRFQLVSRIALHLAQIHVKHARP